MKANDKTTIPFPSAYQEMQSTAVAYLKLGYKGYRKFIAHDLQPNAHSKTMLAKIRRGMQQVLQRRGLTLENPMTGLDINGFYALAAILSLRTEMQALIEFRGKRMILDEMTMADAVTGDRVVLYNLVLDPDYSRANATMRQPRMKTTKRSSKA